MRIAPALPLLLLAVPLLPAQRTATWAPVRRTVRYELRVINPRDEPATDLEVHLPLPWENARQEVRYLHLSRRGKGKEITDRHGQRLVVYRLDELPPRSFLEVGFTAGVVLRHARWHHPDRPDPVGGPTMSARQKAPYLEPRRNYSMDSPLMQKRAAALTAGVTNSFEKLRRIHDFIVENVVYVRDSRWDPAAVILERGSGSCSEYNYLLSGLCRLAGLPTRYVGGSTSRHADLPVSDTVFHRWTEVFLDGVGWFPVDCSRDANPLRGRRSHFGRLYHDALVWCRQGGGGDDLLGWEYRAKTRVKGKDPGVRTNHRTRWLEYVKPDELEAARRWLREGRLARIPGGDALEAALVDWQELNPPARLKTVSALARSGRPVALRRAASLDLPGPKQEALFMSLAADGDLAKTLKEKSRNLWQLRRWFRSMEKDLLPDGKGRFRLREKGAAPKGASTWPGLARQAAAGVLEILGPEVKRVALMAPRDRTGGKAEAAGLASILAGELGARVQVIEGETFEQGLEKAGLGRGEYWLYAMDRKSGLPREYAFGPGPEAILVPISSLAGGRKRLQVKVLVVADVRYLNVTRRQ